MLQKNRKVRGVRPLGLLLTGWAVGVLLPAQFVWAQQGGRDADGAGFLPWLIGFALAVIVCVTAFINPKRSHQT
jgi:hypothetical protein